MKKYISILLVIIFMAGIVAPSYAVGESVTDAVRDEIVELLEKYNEYVLIRNLCVGSIGSEYGNMVFYSMDIPILDWFSYDFNLLDEITSPTPDMNAGDKCVKIDDERFHHHNDFKDMLYDIYTKASAEIFYSSEFAYSYPSGDYGCINTGFSNRPLFITVDGQLYSTEPLKDDAVFTKRYIDLSSVDIYESTKGYVVKARGSTLFKNGEVQDPDSVVKILIIEEDSKLKIDYMESVSDYNKVDYSKLSDEEKLDALFDSIISFDDAIKSSKPVICQFDLTYTQHFAVGYYDYYLVESDRFRNMADLYDWTYNIFLDDKIVDYSGFIGDHPEYIYHQYLAYGDYDSSGRSFARFFYSGTSLYSLDQNSLWLFNNLVSIHNNFNNNKCKLVPFEDGYIGYSYNEYHYFCYFDKVDIFGDGEYRFRISNVKSKFDSELTAKEKEMFGITG